MNRNIREKLFEYSLRYNTDLDQDGEAEEERLVGGGQVDAAVEGDQEDELDEEGGVDEAVGEAGAESLHGAGGRCGLQCEHYRHASTGQQTCQQHLTQEQVTPAGAGLDGLADEEDLEDDHDEDDGGRGREDRDDPDLPLEVLDDLLVAGQHLLFLLKENDFH